MSIMTAGLILLLLLLLIMCVKSKAFNEQCKKSRVVSDEETQNAHEGFSPPLHDIVSKEKQERTGIPRLALTFPDARIPPPITALATVSGRRLAPDYSRFKVQFYKEPNFRNLITQLKDDTSLFSSVQINSPIRSMVIEAVSNDHWRFLQFFSIIIYLKLEPDKRIEFRIPKDIPFISNRIPDTRDRREALEWMSNGDAKIVIFVTNVYDPIPDLIQPICDQIPDRIQPICDR